MIKTSVLSSYSPEALAIATKPKVLRAVLRQVANSARAKWIQLAGAKLHSTRRDYINGIQKVELSGLTAVVTLAGTLPNMVENGADPFDMHDTLLNEGAKVSSTGHKYRAIPFRHQTPGTIGQGGGTPMGQAYAGHPLVQDSKKLGATIHGLAKKLGPGQRLPSGLAPKLKDFHSTDIYAGMQKQTFQKQSTYSTFRTISEAVPDKWLHPGIEAVNLSEEVDEYVKKIAPLAFAAVIPE